MLTKAPNGLETVTLTFELIFNQINLYQQFNATLKSPSSDNVSS